MKRILTTIPLVFLACLFASAQVDQKDLEREVVLYNPYKPSLPEFRKRSFLPDIKDTARLVSHFTYDIAATTFTPDYTISPIKPAALLPDPLPKLYKSFVKLGFGTHVTPMAEVSITNERSKRNAIGFYGRHFSTNGSLKLQNDDRVYAGYMDNDVALYGKKFFRGYLLEGSVDFEQKVRYAYGYDTIVHDYSLERKDVKMGYNNLGADLSFGSLTLDSTRFSYDIDLNYDYFYHTSERTQHNIGLNGMAATKYEGFYIGSGLEFQFWSLSRLLYDKSKYLFSVSPFIKKSTPQWNFKGGLQLLLDRNMTDNPKFHIYPDVSFGFSIVPSFVRFQASLTGRLERNEPRNIILENPFLLRDGSLFRLPNTSHDLVVKAGLNGNNGIGGNYLVSASYSVISDMIFFANQVDTADLISPQAGNFFAPVVDDGEVLNIHGEMTGTILEKIWYGLYANWYNYSMTLPELPLGKPDWDATLGLKYSLRNKIIAGADITALGNRQLAVMDRNVLLPLAGKEPVHVNINLNAEYRYTKILSFWLKANNIAFGKYYQYAYYPTQRFILMVGFSYSL
ncbi:MAG: hypothetical protein MUE74_02785 [Bacteroidales bacterium]|nr:hypothetical protein [Bacteroidales bacterium]